MGVRGEGSDAGHSNARRLKFKIYNRLIFGVVVIYHPFYPEFIIHHSKIGSPERVLQRHFRHTAFGQSVEYFIGFFFAVCRDRQREIVAKRMRVSHGFQRMVVLCLRINK